MLALFMAVCYVESGLDPNAVGDGGKAVGIAQITPILVRDVNRLIQLKNPSIKAQFTLNDRKSVGASFRMFTIYMNHYGKEKSNEDKARIWNSGPLGYKNKATVEYGRKVMRVLQNGARRTKRSEG